MTHRVNISPLRRSEVVLYDVALAVRKNAHAPYSKFKVGAAILSDGGIIFAGCNVENVSYPEGLCAEASAVAAMVAAGETGIKSVLVVTDSENPASPCGGCRQKLAEFSQPDTEVIMVTLDGKVARTSMAELLPLAFSAADMSKATGEGV